MNRTYEIMFIVRPDVEEADLDKLIEGFSANVTGGGGEVKALRRWAGGDWRTRCASSTTASMCC